MTETLVNPPVVEDEESTPSLLSKREQEWLDDLSGLKLASEETRKRIDNHKEGLALIEKSLNDDTIKAGMTYELEKIPSGAWEKFKDKIGALDTLKAIDPDGDPMKEIDAWHDLPGTKGMEPEEIDGVMQTFKEIIKVRDKLEKMPAYQMLDPKTGKTIPDDAKIAADLWQPMVRKGVIPENAVPDKYSEVQKTFKGASEAYDKRLQEYSKDLSDGQKILNALKPGFSVAEGLLKVASASASVAGNAIASAQGVDSAQKSVEARKAIAAKNALDLTLLCVTSTRQMAEKAVEAKDVHGVVDAFNAMLTGVLKATVGKDTALLISSIITCSSRTTKAIKLLAEGDVDGALQAVGDAVATGITQNNSDNKAMAQAIKAGIYGMGAVAKGVQTRDPREALSSALGAAKVLANTAATAIKADAKTRAEDAVKADDSLTEKERDAQLAYISKNVSTAPVGLDDLTGGIQSGVKLKSLDEMMSATIDKEKLAEEQAAFQETQQKAMLEFRNEPDPEFEELLVNGFTDTDSEIDGDADKELRDLERQANKIETLIAICKKDQMTYDLTKQILGGGTKFVASLLPAAGVIAVGTQLVFAILEAVKHSEQLAIWAESLEGAKKAKTVQADAIMNRFGLQKSQTIRADILVALKAIDLIGQVVKTAGGPAAPAGLATSAAAQAVEGVMDIALTIKTEVEMASAWSVYKKALKTPQDRKLARLALQKNPTLSKYAMAYGACIEKNPVAMNAMKMCGLSPRTMADPGTNVSKVVDYLETVYREDPKLLKAVTDPKKWHAGKPELSVLSWSTFYANATDPKSKDINPKVKAGDVSKISAAMTAYAKAHAPVERFFEDGWKADASDDPASLDAVRKAAQVLAAGLASYNPVDVDGDPHPEMADYVDDLNKLAEAIVSDVDECKDEINEVQAEAKAIAEMMSLASEDDEEFTPDMLKDIEDVI